VRSRIVMVHNDPSSLVRFRNTSGGVPFRIDCLTLLKQATIFFDLARLYKHRFNDSCDDLNNVFWWMPLPQGILWHNDCFWTFTIFDIELAPATIEFIKPVFYSSIGWCFVDVLLSWKLWIRMARKCLRVNSIFLPR